MMWQFLVKNFPHFALNILPRQGVVNFAMIIS